MSVTLTRIVRLRVPAGGAKPGPAIGQALGPLGINMADFCKKFNEATKVLEKDIPIPVALYAYSNRTFTFVPKTPTVTWFLKRCIGIKKGAAKTGHDVAGKIHVKQIYEIGKMQHRAMAHIPLQSICRSIVASCGSMGIQVVRD